MNEINYLFPYPLILFYLNSEKNFIFQHQSNNPNFIWLDRFIFLLYKKQSHIASSAEYLFGLSQKFNADDYSPNSDLNQLKVCIISKEAGNKLRENALRFLLDLHINNAMRKFNFLCQTHIKRKATELEKSSFKSQYSKFAFEQLYNDTDTPLIMAFKAVFNIK